MLITTELTALAAFCAVLTARMLTAWSPGNFCWWKALVISVIVKLFCSSSTFRCAKFKGHKTNPPETRYLFYIFDRYFSLGVLKLCFLGILNEISFLIVIGPKIHFWAFPLKLSYYCVFPKNSLFLFFPSLMAEILFFFLFYCFFNKLPMAGIRLIADKSVRYCARHFDCEGFVPLCIPGPFP